MISAFRLLLLVLVATGCCCCCSAFVTTHQRRQQVLKLTLPQQQPPQQLKSFLLRPLRLAGGMGGDDGQGSSGTTTSFDNTSPPVPQQPTRRQFWQTAAVAALVTTGTTWSAEPARATYSAYSRREDDWKQRQSEGAVQFSSAASLRSQLREIAPMNASERRLFCPNGTPSAVSPLMENKCGDRLAMPSVYGRTEDVMGNSIPGFAGGFYSAGLSSSAISSSSADTGGLPSYSKYTGK